MMKWLSILALILCAALPSAAKEAGEPKMFIRPELSMSTGKNKGYVGQKIDYTLKLYTTASNILAAQPMAHIQPEGCDVRIINDLTEPYLEGKQTVDGVEYNVAVLERKIVEPLTKGTLVIPPIDYKIVLGEYELVGEDFFFGPRYRTIRKDYSLTSEKLKVNVKPLPTPAPSCYSGAIGEYTAEVSVPKGVITKGEENILYITVSGAGSLQDIDPMSLQSIRDAWGDKIKIQRVTDQEDSYWQNSKFISEKSYEVTFVPESTGTITLPSLTFCYFNPITGKYSQAVSEPFDLKVQGRRSSTKNTEVSI